MHPEVVEEGAGSCPKCGMALEAVRPETSQDGGEYICPMHPEVQENKPGICPICGMKLIEVKAALKSEMAAHESSHEGHTKAAGKTVAGYSTVMLSPEKQQLIGIRLAEVVKEPAVKMIRTVGRIAYDPELYQAQEEYLQAIQAFEKAKASVDPDIQARAEKLVESAKIKLELMGFSEALIAELVTKGAADRSLLMAQPGEKVWMYAPIYENELELVKVAQTVTVTLQSGSSGTSYEGKIQAIDPVLDPTTRSIKIRAELENPDGILRPNVYVNAEIEVDLGKQILIPESSVLDSGERKIQG